jgi:acetylornithine/N-succinyldiaminopimelate aminotransferase
MNLFDVYPLFDIEPVKAEGSWVWDKTGTRYLDLYGGHAVISIGHSHPRYVQHISEQVAAIGFYSNSVKIPLQETLAHQLGELSGYSDYRLFLCNSGAEANENAFKLASFHTNRRGIIAFSGGFHGRTSLAVAATDNPAIVAPVNQTSHVRILPFNDAEAVTQAFSEEVPAAVIVEGIQGVGGVKIPSREFLQTLRSLCTAHGAVLILDEIQSGAGRTGKYFAHQHAGIQADLITMAKGIGNGFPMGGVMISPAFKASHGLLGTTFGGSHLACAAGLAVAEITREENLMQHASVNGARVMESIQQMPHVKEVRGEGLMIGIELDFPAAEVRQMLLEEHHIFTGSSSCKYTLRILPALNIRSEQLTDFLVALNQILTTIPYSALVAHEK